MLLRPQLRRQCVRVCGSSSFMSYVQDGRVVVGPDRQTRSGRVIWGSRLLSSASVFTPRKTHRAAPTPGLGPSTFRRAQRGVDSSHPPLPQHRPPHCLCDGLGCSAPAIGMAAPHSFQMFPQKPSPVTCVAIVERSTPPGLCAHVCAHGHRQGGVHLEGTLRGGGCV